jgi:hypothetical protein
MPHRFAKDELRGIDDAPDGGHNFVAQRRGLRGQIEKSNLSQFLYGGLAHAAG